MKVTDLMVGDWVSYCGFYNKVIYIGQKVSMYNGKGTEFTTDPEYIRPIPLTENILVKNGFEKGRDEDVTTFKYGNLFLFYYPVGTGLYSYNTQIIIHYVHTLQHLLRLVGIQKEIEV